MKYLKLILLSCLCLSVLLSGCGKSPDPSEPDEPNGPVEVNYPELRSFSYSHAGTTKEDIYTYTFTKTEDGVLVDVLQDAGNLDLSVEMDESIMEELQQIVQKGQLHTWDGFSEIDSQVLDGEDFQLAIAFINGDTITAGGSNAFPDGYTSFREDLTPVIQKVQDAIAQDPLCQIRTQMWEESCGIAVAYLGYFDQSADQIQTYLKDAGMLEEFPFLEDISPDRLASAGGGELYLVVPPKYVDEVTVRDWIIDESNDFVGEAGNAQYYNGADEPFLLTCNVSDIMPNAVISTNFGVEYTPSLSLQDGSLSAPGVYSPGVGVLDITPYDLNQKNFDAQNGN